MIRSGYRRKSRTRLVITVSFKKNHYLLDKAGGIGHSLSVTRKNWLIKRGRKWTRRISVVLIAMGKATDFLSSAVAKPFVP